MKKMLPFILALIAAVGTQAQVVNVCGTDSIFLQVENYDGLGVIEWQESIDLINWVTIPEIVGEMYKFLPTQTKHYRAVVKTSSCDPLYSAFSFVQLPPIANAGVDKVTGASYTILQGNKLNGTIGEWKIITGGGGTISEINNPNTQFYGIVNQAYSLTWTVTNACGQSTDTVNVRFSENIFNGKYIVVDNTDSLYSDSTEMATGLYRIKFSDSTIIPVDSVLLLGMRQDVSFLRKVTSFTLQDSIYSFITEQGTLEDLLLKGTINFGDAINQSISEANNQSQSSRVKRLNTFPTRQILKENVDNKDVILLYSDKNSENNRLKVANSINSSYVFDTKYGKIYYDLFENLFDLNIICEYDVIPFHVKFGFSNSNISLTQKVKFDFKLAGIDKIDYKLFSLFNYIITIPPGIVIHIDVPIKVYSNISTVGGPIITRTDNYSNTFSTYVESSDYFSSVIHQKFSESHTSTSEISPLFQGGIQADFKIGPELQFRIFDVLIPYAGYYAKANFNFRANTDLNFSGKAAFGLVGNVGVKCETPKLFSKEVNKLFDFNQVFTSDKYSYKLNWPNKIELISGNNQKGLEGTILTKPIVFKVTDPFGNGNPFVPVRIATENGNGTVQSSVFMTDLLGQVSVNWNLGTNDECELKAYVLDYENMDIEGSPIYVTAYSSGGATTCENSNLALTINSTSSYKYPVASGGTAPYTYSKNGIDFSSAVPQFNLSTSGFYTVYVKDKNQCSIIKSFTINAPNPCNNADLTMDIVTTSNTICVTGKKGTSPYLYAIENQTNFSANNIFSNLSTGYYTIYVKDANGCIVSSDVKINAATSAAIRASYPAQGATSIPLLPNTFQWVAATYANNQVYDLYLKKGTGAYKLIASNLNTTSFTYNTALLASYAYTWKVSVKSVGDVLDYSEFTFTTASGLPTTPTVPVLLQPATFASVYATTNIKWTPQAGDFKYDLYLDNNNATTLVAMNLNAAEYTVSNLVSGKTYYWKVKIKSTITGATATSTVWSFVVLNSGNAVTDIDGNIYHTVTIGTQTWLVENLKTTRYRNGDAIGTKPGEVSVYPESYPKYQWAYNDDENNAVKYGRLYTWYAVVDTRNIAPIGWHVPSNAEWTILVNFLIANGYNYDGTTTENRIAKALAANTDWVTSNFTGSIGKDLTINNSSGFTALPAGRRNYSGSFQDVGYNCSWWSTTQSEFSYNYANGSYIEYSKSLLFLTRLFKFDGLSVRCVRDY